MNLVLGVSGSIAAYRAADLARELIRSGYVVRVCLTDSAQKFVSAALFEGLTGQPCLVDTFEEPDRGRMAHIDWARWADAVLIAPATANTLNRLAVGVGDDMLTTLCLASTRPLFVAPAMNPAMYNNDATQSALRALTERGVFLIEPVEGDVACGENGQGKLASIGAIVSFVTEALEAPLLLEGKRVLITSGPTQEPIDSVRFITNRSSGKMGAALALAALRMGAEVAVVAGPQREPFARGISVTRVQTAAEMLSAALTLSEGADLIIGAAAVADYRVAEPIAGKIRRETDELALRLVANTDIIATLAANRPQAMVVGFAAEPSASLDTAREKVQRKGLTAIAANDVSLPGIGFDSIENEIHLIFADDEVRSSGRMSKMRVARWLLTQLAERTVSSRPS